MSVATETRPGIDPNVPPSGTGCVECLKMGNTWWLHLRRCAECGHIGCCDSSPNRHGSKHSHATGHPIGQSFEKEDDGYTFEYATGEEVLPHPVLKAPHYHPVSQPVPYHVGKPQL